MDLTDNLSDLYLLTRVIEAGGFAAAARQTGMTRSLLSRRIVGLEQRLGGATAVAQCASLCGDAARQ